ncbi:MAG TPA: acetate kinase [Armatimonadota bacterium]|jgi:acetate kinase
MHVLVINSGSSSVKARFIETESRALLGKGLVDRIGSPESALEWTDDGNAIKGSLANATVESAVDRLIGLAEGLGTIGAVGHRIVHGGELYTRPTLVDDSVVKGVEDCAAFAPLHNPAHAEGLRAARKALPHVPHVCVFDTAFHATIPVYAHRYAIPTEYYENYGVRRYGAHGTSHQYLSATADEWLASKGVPAPHRVITAHLGNGSSISAVRDGVCAETSMGFTPLEGLIMGTRCGDMDCAVVPFLMERKGWSPADADRFLNKDCGLLGVSGVSSDMRDIERARSEGNPDATLAFDMFCYRIRKYVGAFTSVLGGLDALVFSGGIGEHSDAVRREVLAGLGWLGLRVDDVANADPRGDVCVISQPSDGPVALVIPTDEEGLIAHQTADVALQAAR